MNDKSTPKIQDAIIPEDVKVTDKSVDTGESMIVHRETYVDGNGVQQTREHGPMPLSEWPDYAKKNGF